MISDFDYAALINEQSRKVHLALLQDGAVDYAISQFEREFGRLPNEKSI